MADAKKMKTLFSSIMLDDYNSFFMIAQEIIKDEKEKGHFKLARELEDIVSRRATKRTIRDKYIKSSISLIPKDKNGVELFNLYTPNKPKNLIMSKKNKADFSSIFEEYIRRDTLNSFGLNHSKVILFHGYPGTGKTLSAHTIAYDLGFDVIYARFDSLISSFLGETASNLSKIFDFISKGRFVVIFDEFDTISLSRRAGNENGEIKRVVNTFLQMLDNYKGDSFIICNTNMFDVIDNAIVRRFDKVVEFEMPSSIEISNYLSKYKKYFAKAQELDEAVSLLKDKSYSDIERIINNTLKKSILKDDKPSLSNKEIRSNIM